MTEQSRSGLQAELDVLRQRLGDLEAKQRESARRLSRSRRPGFSRKFLLGALPAALLVAAGGLLYGAAAIDALFIDKDGNAIFSGGKIQLDGNQQIKFTDSDISNNLKLQLWGGYGLGINGGTLFYAANGRHSWRDNNGTNERMALTTAANGGLNVSGTGNSSFAGNVGIGTTTPSAKLEVDLKNADGWKGNLKALRLLAPDSNYHLDVNTYVVAGGNVGYQFSPSFSEKDKPVKSEAGLTITTPGYVGIGTTDPKDKLDVAGPLRILTGSNGIRFTSAWSGFPDAVTNQAEISNDTGTYKSLMIAGNQSGGGEKRRVQIYDQLDVKGALFVSGTLAYHWGPDNQWKHIENRAGDFAGSYNSAAPVSSDRRFKSDLRSIPSALNKVSNLRGVTYRWNEAALEYFTRDIETTISAGPNATAEENQRVWQTERNKRHKELANTLVGVVAQDVEAVLPEAVSTDKAGYKSVRYHYLIPLLIEALKEQDKTVRDQAQIVAQQLQEIARLAAANLAVQQQLADLAAVRAQMARLEATLQRGAAARSFVVPTIATRLSTAQAR